MFVASHSLRLLRRDSRDCNSCISSGTLAPSLLHLLLFPLGLFFLDSSLWDGDYGAEHFVEGLELVGAVALGDGLGAEDDGTGQVRRFH